MKEDGLTLNANIGNIVMKDAEFSYPNREQSHVIRNDFDKNHFADRMERF